MPQLPDPAGLAVFLTELHGFFEACDQDVDAALARHFGEDTAPDWIIAVLELVIESLTGRPMTPVPTSELSGAHT
ncbi:hypothetical protein QMK19_29090 [Streptomyces sp. H10-C2]|uniref:hypothetical protein n=1 Tax=unclassified Streptomyces TaxID=2593676 RepID=UPI0022AE8115|nr:MULTISPECIES: hypothetical protein [unclassified Streptomyces]MCZ4103731.1 hypothetical protein [Streptomyces sp. H39-C1]MDJ0344267.1 hypothetical protein [Streptomyces sp. PH10-H1]MDJ0373605.1 hypothetical protein [Streptomyces sp. H10-C2]